jgi:hypothetical protein
VTLTQARPDPAIPHRADDRSDHAHRQWIGYFGLMLPVVLPLLAVLFPATGLARLGPYAHSISAYYYTAAIAAFIGLLVAMALFLFTYRGYDNEHGWVDRAAAITAGIAALGVAVFPTGAPQGAEQLAWWSAWMRYAHYGSAVLLFAMFALFSLWLFRKSGTQRPLPPDKVRRNRVYLSCGLAIVGGMAWAFINARTGRSIFLPEVVMVAAFAISWLTKGYALRSIARTVRSLTESGA